jgi:hypothetical protein
MFQGKNASSVDKKMVSKINIIIANVDVIDMNVATRNRIRKEQMYEEK